MGRRPPRIVGQAGCWWRYEAPFSEISGHLLPVATRGALYKSHPLAGAVAQPSVGIQIRRQACPTSPGSQVLRGMAGLALEPTALTWG